MRTLLVAAVALLLAGCGTEPPGAPVTSGLRAPAPPAGGATAPDLEALAARTATAAWVHVTVVETVVDDATGLPFTYFTAVVDDGLRGCAAGEPLVWRLLGGTVNTPAGPRGVVLHDAPAFHTGERALVLLTEPGKAGWPRLVGLGAGKWVPAPGATVASSAGIVAEETLTALLRAPRSSR